MNLVTLTGEFTVHDIEGEFDVFAGFPLDGGRDTETFLMALPGGLAIATREAQLTGGDGELIRNGKSRKPTW